jgi:acetoin utilization deacetylase AcuC-like enzyme
LLHTCKDGKFNEVHCENEDRVFVSYEYLKIRGVLEGCQVFSDFEEVNDESIVKTHGKDYLKQLMKLDQKAQRKIIWTDSDCYFNKHSLRASKLAANATL